MKLKFFKYIILSIFSFWGFISPLYSQLDTVFWFAAPEVSIANLTFDRPIYLWITSSNASSQVTISQPANPSFNPIILNLPPLTTNFVNLTNWIDQIECKPANQVLNYGLKIESTNPITAYYEVVSLQCNCNPEIFALKGRNGLGTNFFIPMQNFLSNANHTSYTPTPYCSFDIVATQDNTMVTITPSSNIVGHNANIPFTITLNKGQTYSATATSQLANQHLNGSMITSNKPIAVTIKDDLIQNSTCADLAGDQIVPIEHIGTNYIVVKGFLTGTTDRVFILGTQNNTSVSINGVQVTTLNIGQTYTYNFSTTNAAYIETTNPVYVLQLSGFGCEVGYSIIPQIECSGSSEVSFTRSTSNPLHITLIVPQGGEGSFLLNNLPGIINSSSFSDVPSTSGLWKYAQITFTETQIPIGTTTKISNSSDRFHLGFIHGNTNNGCRFGYFSDFAKYKFEIIADETIFCEGDTLLLSVNNLDDATFIWNGPNGFTSNETSIEHFPLNRNDEGYYLVNGFLGDCPIEPDSIYIQVDTIFQPELTSNDTYFCEGDTMVMYTNIQEGINYTWQTPNGTFLNDNTLTIHNISILNKGNYFLSNFSNSCPIISDTIFINIDIPSTLQIATNDNNFCIGDTIYLEAILSQDITFNWSGPNGFNSQNQFHQIFPIETDYSGLYILNALDTICIIEPDTISINVFNQPTISVSPQNPEICKGKYVEITANGGCSYIWNTLNQMSSITVSPNTNTMYSVIGTDIHNCKDTAMTEVIVKPNPNLTVSPNPIVMFIGEIVTLTVTSDLPETSFQWTNGEVINSIEISPEQSMIMGVEGIADGCKTYVEISIIVKIPLTECYIYFPNSFTPNHDGLNDLFAPIGENIEMISFTIYNRWGELIYQSYEPFPSWDGFSNGKLVPSGVYHYFVRYKKADTGELKQKQGSVSLIR